MLDKNSENIDPIKNSFSQFKRKAPESLWNDIDKNLSLNNDEHLIGHAFNVLERKAPSSSWQNVKRQLIIDQVWLNISAQLNERKKRFFWFYLSGFVAMLILGFVTIQTFMFENQIGLVRNSENISLPEKHKLFETNNSVVENQFPNVINENEIQNEPVESNAANNSKVHTQKNDLTEDPSIQNDENILSQQNIEFKNDDNKLEVEQKSDFINSTDVLSFSKLPLSPICTIPLNYSVPFSIEPIEKYKPIFNRYEVGLTTGINNTWIFNNDVKEGLSRFSLVDNKFSIGYNAGMTFVFNFLRRHSIGLEVDFISKLNQRYSYYEDGNICTHQVSISQQKYGLNYRYTTMNIFSKNQSFIFKVGAYFSKAFKSEFYSDKELFMDQVIGNYDFGIKTGIGSQHRFGNLILEYGIQSDAGLINIATSPSYNSKKFNYTTTYLAGIYCSLRYSF